MRRASRVCVAVAASAVSLFLAAPAGAANIPVLNTNDTGADSLRAAITAANANGVAEADTIPINATGTINVASDLPLISGPMTITGPGAGSLTVRASGTGYSLFSVFTSNAAHTVKIEGMTIADADTFTAGGAIGIGAALGLTIVDNVHITGNTSGSGGGIHNSGRLLLTDSTLDDNEAPFGGGVVSSTGSVSTIVNTTVHGNRAEEFGGGIYASGGAVSVTLLSSTITGNKSDSDDTGLTGDGGGIYRAGAPAIFSVGNTILAGNTVGTSASLSPPVGIQCGGAFTSLGYNLRQSSETPCTGFSGTGDIVNALTGLGSFGNNGGPTPTVPLLTGSPAINGGNPAMPGPMPPACEATDQRGFSRVAFVQPCDIGAVEAQVPTFPFPGNKTVHAGETLAFTLTATDPDPDPLTFFMNNGPIGATLDPGTGAFSWTPSAAQIGSHPAVQLGASDGFFSSSTTITITVTSAPVVSPPGNPPSGTPPGSTSTATGQRAAGLKRCARKKGKGRKKCRKKAKKLPV